MSNGETRPREWIVQVMNHVEGQVMFGDTKAGQLLATDSLLLAALVILAKDLRNDVAAVTSSFGAAAGLTLGTSLVFVLVSIAPSQKHPAEPTAMAKPGLECRPRSTRTSKY